jgi:hypothetical protein
MTIKQVEEKVIELKHRRPFVPFVFEMNNGQKVEVHEPGMAINETGMGFIGHDDALVDVEFRNVCTIRLLNSEAAA